MITKISGIFSEFIDVSEIDINEGTVLSSDIGMSSIDYFEFISRIEEEFKVKISDRELLKLKTVGDIIECVNKKL